MKNTKQGFYDLPKDETCKDAEHKWTKKQEKEYQQRRQWFIDRIGKRVFREDVFCQCETCKRISKEGLIINDEMHAIYLHDVECISNAEGHKLKYRDERKV